MSSPHTQPTPVVVPDSVLSEILENIPQDKLKEILEKHFPPQTHTAQITIGITVLTRPPPVVVMMLTTESDKQLAQNPADVVVSFENESRAINTSRVFPTVGTLARRLKDRTHIHIDRRCGTTTSDKLRDFINHLEIYPESVGPAGPLEREAILDFGLDLLQELCEAFTVTTQIAVQANRRNLKTMRQLFEQHEEIEREIGASSAPDATQRRLVTLLQELGLL